MDDNGGRDYMWPYRCLEHCESHGISRAVVNLFIRQRGLNYEQDHRKTEDSRI